VFAIHFFHAWSVLQVMLENTKHGTLQCMLNLPLLVSYSRPGCMPAGGGCNMFSLYFLCGASKGCWHGEVGPLVITPFRCY
jgi:hypothetical protein